MMKRSFFFFFSFSPYPFVNGFYGVGVGIHFSLSQIRVTVWPPFFFFPFSCLVQAGMAWLMALNILIINMNTYWDIGVEPSVEAVCWSGIKNPIGIHIQGNVKCQLHIAG